MGAKTFISTRELAAELGVSVELLAQARTDSSRGKGFAALPYVKIGRRVFYRRCDVDKFVEKHLVAGKAIEAA